MGKSTVVPFGPQHPVLPEPIHFDLELEDEKVVKAIPSIGYVHRGLEKLVEKRGFQEYVYVAERVCGICSFGHGWGYSKAIEGLMEIEIPKRAEYLRTIWHEISRLHSHLLWACMRAGDDSAQQKRQPNADSDTSQDGMALTGPDDSDDGQAGIEARNGFKVGNHMLLQSTLFVFEDSHMMVACSIYIICR